MRACIFADVQQSYSDWRDHMLARTQDIPNFRGYAASNRIFYRTFVAPLSIAVHDLGLLEYIIAEVPAQFARRAQVNLSTGLQQVRER